MAGLVVACSPDPTESVEYQQAAVDLEASTAALDEARAERDGYADELAQLEAELAEAEGQRNRAERELSRAQSDLKAAEETVDDLLLRYDEQIRADLRAAYDAEVQRACEEAAANPRKRVASTTRFDRQWAVLGLDEDRLDAAVEECAGPARKAASLTRDEAAQALASHVDAAIDVLRARRAVNDERQRMARELHDVVGHGVSVVVVQAVAAAGLLDKERFVEARNRVDAIERTARQALDEMRRLVGLLGEDGGDVAPQPGLDQLHALVEEVRGTGLAVEVCVPTALTLSPGLDLTVFRIVQEALTNVLKHAQADRARVDIELDDDTLEVSIRDDGIGGRAQVLTDAGWSACGNGWRCT